MAIVPIFNCRRMQPALDFYTGVLDFRVVGGDESESDPAYRVIARGSDYLILSSFPGDGRAGQAVVVTSDDVDADWSRFRSRGLVPVKSADVSPVHAGPLEQTWGTREFYVDDPDGHTLRFTQRWFD